jgi:DNA-binding winged helix-turn-helix (wHTH) protein
VERPASPAQTWRFGVFEVDGLNADLRRDGRPVKMREQSLRILIFLLEHPSQVVTREALRAVLWPSDTFVDFDHSLNTAVMKLRDVLGDFADRPLYIETIPKRGYRSIAPMTIVTTAAPPIALSSGPPEGSLPLGLSSAHRRRRRPSRWSRETTSPC